EVAVVGHDGCNTRQDLHTGQRKNSPITAVRVSSRTAVVLLSRQSVECLQHAERLSSFALAHAASRSHNGTNVDLVADRPDDNGRMVVILANQLSELLRGVLDDGLSRRILGQ